MELFFLGTSAGVPTKERNLSAIALTEEQGKAWYLIDCGEGTQHRILNTNLSLNHLKIILITHIHGDHCYGLPGLLASAAMGGRSEKLTIIAPKGIKEWIESTFKNTGLYLPYNLEFVEAESLNNCVYRNFFIESVELSHRVPSFAYSFTEISVEAKLDTEKLKKDKIPKGPLWGELKDGRDVKFEGKLLKSESYISYDRESRKIVIAGDNDKPELLYDFMKNADILVHESTYTKEYMDKAIEGRHSYAEAVGKFAELVSVNNLILTHFSPRYQQYSEKPSSTRDHYEEAKKVFAGNVLIAEDFDRYLLNRDKDLIKIDPNSQKPVLKVIGNE